MDEILEEVKTLDTKLLREKLLENGVKVGPIAPSTISLFQKRLAKEIFRRRGGVEEEQSTEESEPVKKIDPVDNFKRDNSSSNVAVPGVFFAVCLPENTEQDNDTAEQLVFSDKDLALKTAKKYTGSRFKVFKSEQDAKVFSRLKADAAFQSPCRPSKEETPVKEAGVSSESSSYRAPKPQDLAKLRKVIEGGDVDTFREQVWLNPRFLVSSGDTPSIYQEGPRYTAMHVAAMKNKPEICQAILDILENPEFVNRLYGQSKHTGETQSSRINFLVDLYLNMPDKGSCESPLHMACKYGHEKVVEILAAHPKTDKQLKNKWGDMPKDIICSRCSTSSQTSKKNIEDFLEGQCYVPLMRSEDNTMPPLIGQPWSPDHNKSTDMPRITQSPRDPSMSVKACAGPMSPTDAGLFHKRWTTPPSVSQSPDQAKAYFNIKRSDSEKGMERIGRQLAQELKVPWSEYWEFLDQFIDLSNPAGLDVLEYYLKKGVWLTFVKEFKDKFGITEQLADFTDLATPVSKGFRPKVEEDADKSFDSLFSREIVDNKEESAGCDGKDIGNKPPERKEKSDICNEKQIANANSVLSPMSELSNCFANLKMDDSWSERATIDSSEKSLADDGDNDKAGPSVNNVPVDNDNKVEDKGNEKSNRIYNNDCLTSKETAKSDDDKLNESEKSEERAGNSRDLEEKNTVDKKTAGDLSVQRVPSVESDSTASYETAAENLSDSEHTFCSQLSEPGNVQVVIRLKDSAILTQLTEYVNANELYSVASFVVQIKDYMKNNGLKVNIVSVPWIDSVQKLLLLEDVDVAACDGDLSTVQEGEIIELGTSCGGEDQSVMAYLTRAVTLPKTKYIHGPQPTREDLNVSRALSTATICPELHPNVFHWKISLSRFLRDTNYRWQSPAKLQSRLRQGSPQPSPLGKRGLVTQYGSPLSGKGQPASVIPSDIRTQLFPSITE